MIFVGTASQLEGGASNKNAVLRVLPSRRHRVPAFIQPELYGPKIPYANSWSAFSSGRRRKRPRKSACPNLPRLLKRRIWGSKVRCI